MRALNTLAPVVRWGVVAGLTCGLVATGLGPAAASPGGPAATAVKAAADLRAKTLHTGVDAAAALKQPTPTPAPVADKDQDPKEDTAPAGTGEITPGKAVDVAADPVGAKLRFSGHDVKDHLAVEVHELADGAGRVAAAETGGVVLASPVSVTATGKDGKGVTSFPADPTIEHSENGPDVVTAVDPGVGLELAIDQTRLGKEPGKVDPGSVRIMTRENPGDPWVALPSYYDAKTGKVRGESDHLSQFAVIGTPFVPPAGPRVVLDPDDDVANTTGPNGNMTELGQNVRLANDLKTMMAATCKADVVITRDASLRFVSPQTRAAVAAAHNPDLTVTLAFDALYGHPWGVAVDGGTKVYSRGNGDDNAVTGSLVAQMPGYTGRPAKTASQGGVTALPYPALGSLPGAVTHLETLYIDHNYDRPVVDNGFASITNGVFTGLGKYLETKGFNCTNPATGGWPAKPSAADLAKWRNLGFHNFQAYGAEPVSFTTGNLIEKYDLFTLTGPGNQSQDINLVYNSQDGRESRTGAGVSFGSGARAQRFDDGSVLAVRGDGASYVFTGNGAGGYTAESGTLNTLAEAGNGQLRLSSPEGESWVFDAADVEGIGELASHTDRQGNTTTLGYGPGTPDTRFVPLTSITDAGGQRITVGNDALGRITSFTHPDGRVWGLGYDGAGNLGTITYPDGRTRTFTYDGAHQLLTATDPMGITYLRNEYDAAGRVVKQWDAEGTERGFVYDDGAKTTTYVDNEGNKTVYTRDDAYRVTSMLDAAGGEQKFSYDEHNQVTGYTDANGHATTYSYDAGGHVASTTAADGAVTSYTYTPSGDLASSTDTGGPGNTTRTTSFDNDGRGLPVTVHLPDGTTVSNAFDGGGNLTASTDQNGNTTTYAYDTRGNLLTVTDPLGRTRGFAYDAANRVTAATDPRGNTSTYAWDTANRLTTQTDPAGGVTTLAYDGNDHLVSATDPTGAVTKYDWDALFRVTGITKPDGSKTSYAYNREDELVKITDPLGAETRFDLDPLYRVVKTTDPLGGAWTRSWDKTGNLITSTDPENGTTTNTYDALNRLTTTTDPTGAATKYELDTVGRTTTVTDPAGGEQRFVYDVMDRLVKAIDQAGNATSTAYDKAGNPLTITDRRGQAWKRSYDSAGQLTTITDPTGAGAAFGYDGNGNRTTVTDPLKRVTTTAYDALNRPTAVKNPAGETTTTSYDPVGRVTATTDGDGDAWTRAYDIAGNLVKTIDPDGVTASYGWDAAGNQTTMTDGNGTLTAYSWDKAAQLIDVTENRAPGKPQNTDTNVTTSYAYSPAGHLTEVTNPNGNKTTFTHDPNGRTTKETNPAGNTWTYQYDPRGLLVKQKDANGNTTSNAYTPTGDLATVSYSSGQKTTYGYDAEQAMITMDDTLGASAWEYDARGALTSQTDALGKKLFYDYDPAGELTTLTLPAGNTTPATAASAGFTAGQATTDKPVGISYSYDPAGRVKSQASPWGSMDYTYTPAGATGTVKRSNGVTTTTAYTPANRTKTITHTTPKPAATAAGTAAAGTAAATTGATGPAVDPASGQAGAGTATTTQSPDQTTDTGAAAGVVPAPKPVSTEAKACTTAASYLAGRSLPETGATGTNCVKTADYLKRRSLPTTDAGIAAGESLTVGYAYDKNGNTTMRTRTNGTTTTPTTPVSTVTPNSAPANPGTGAIAGTTDKRDYSYDPLNRLTGTETSGVKNSYSYDRNGNRTGWATTDNPATTAAGDALDVTALFDKTDQLTTETRTGTGAGPSGSATTKYGYDQNGNRTKTAVSGGPTTSYSYTPDNQTSSVTRPGLESSYKYDGLGRNLTTTDTTQYGDHHTSTAFNGLTPIQNTDNHGTGPQNTSNLIPDNLGHAALQTGTSTIEDRWELLDRLGSTIAQTTNTPGAGTIDQLSEYSDFGVQEYGTTGWDADADYTGQPTNPTYGTHQFHARTLDPQTGTWTGHDKWRGLQTQPQTLNRYTYVTNNPTNLVDYMGYWPWDSIGHSSPQPAQPGPWASGYVYPTPTPSYTPAPQPAPAPPYIQPTYYAPQPPYYKPAPTYRAPNFRLGNSRRISTLPVSYNVRKASATQISTAHVTQWGWPDQTVSGCAPYNTPSCVNLPYTERPEVTNHPQNTFGCRLDTMLWFVGGVSLAYKVPAAIAAWLGGVSFGIKLFC